MPTRESSPGTEGIQPAASADLPGRPAGERRVMVWVGKSVVFKGELVSSEDMSIDGRVEGTVAVRDHTLTIGPDAEIHANISAKIITIHGAVTGSVKASDKVDIRDTGKVDGNITAPRIAIAEGANLHGRIDTMSERGPGRHLTVVA